MSSNKVPFSVRLIMPTSPSHDLDCDPDGQPEYANPVTVNNYQIVYSNALHELTDIVVKGNKQLEGLKKEKRAADRALDDFGNQILRKANPKAINLKTLKMQDAFISEKAEEFGQSIEYEALTEESRKLEDQIGEVQAKIKSARDWIDSIRLASDNGKTFLAFWKADAERVRRGY